jgi:hypothetical protein
MMKYILISSLAVLAGCSTRTDSSRSGADSSDFKQSVKTDEPVDDSVIFAGVIRKFEGNDELYTALFFKGDFDQTLYDFLTKSSDSLVYQSDEIKRSALPFPVASEYFDLRGLDKIEVYDTSGHLIGRAKLARVEYLEEMIEAGFIAVFNFEKKKSGNPAYCVSTGHEAARPKNFSYKVRTSGKLNKEILAKLPMPSAGEYNFMEMVLLPVNKTYLLISGDTTAFLYDAETNDLLYKSKSSEIIIDAIPIPVSSAERPLFLVSFGLPETDAFWESLMEFNGTRYELCARNRFKP